MYTKNYNKYYRVDGVRTHQECTNTSIAERSWIKANGIDRIDSTQGYELINSVPCCTICNRMKLDHSKMDFLTHIQKILNFQKVEDK